jgi:hypothetical protein
MSETFHWLCLRIAGGVVVTCARSNPGLRPLVSHFNDWPMSTRFQYCENLNRMSAGKCYIRETGSVQIYLHSRTANSLPHSSTRQYVSSGMNCWSEVFTWPAHCVIFKKAMCTQYEMVSLCDKACTRSCARTDQVARIPAMATYV